MYGNPDLSTSKYSSTELISVLKVNTLIMQQAVKHLLHCYNYTNIKLCDSISNWRLTFSDFCLTDVTSDLVLLDVWLSTIRKSSWGKLRLIYTLVLQILM